MGGITMIKINANFIFNTYVNDVNFEVFLDLNYLTREIKIIPHKSNGFIFNYSEFTEENLLRISAITQLINEAAEFALDEINKHK